MNNPPLSALAVYDQQESFSLDAHIAAVITGSVMFIQVVTDDHPRVSKGDVLVVEDGVEGEDKDLLLLDVNGKHILRQKKFVKTLIRQSQIHLVGGNTYARTRVIGRVVGWLHAPPPAKL